MESSLSIDMQHHGHLPVESIKCRHMGITDAVIQGDLHATNFQNLIHDWFSVIVTKIDISNSTTLAFHGINNYCNYTKYTLTCE